MAELSEWLNLMLAEISRKQDDDLRARAELASRAAALVEPPQSQASAPSAEAPSR